MFLKKGHEFPFVKVSPSTITSKGGTTFLTRGGGVTNMSLHKQSLLNDPYLPVHSPILLPSHNLLPLEAQTYFLCPAVSVQVITYKSHI